MAMSSDSYREMVRFTGQKQGTSLARRRLTLAAMMAGARSRLVGVGKVGLLVEHRLEQSGKAAWCSWSWMVGLLCSTEHVVVRSSKARGTA